MFYLSDARHLHLIMLICVGILAITVPPIRLILSTIVFISILFAISKALPHAMRYICLGSVQLIRFLLKFLIVMLIVTGVLIVSFAIAATLLIMVSLTMMQFITVIVISAVGMLAMIVEPYYKISQPKSDNTTDESVRPATKPPESQHTDTRGQVQYGHVAKLS